jgi:hypothetical protein
MDSNIIASLILSISGIVISLITSIIFGYIPKIRKRKIELLEKELLNTYSDISEFQKLVKNLIEISNISKINARKDLSISANSQPKRLQKRISELKLILK